MPAIQIEEPASEPLTFAEAKAFLRGMTFTGSATGKRYTVQYGGVINSGGAGTSFYPGNVAGTGTTPGASPYGSYV